MLRLRLAQLYCLMLLMPLTLPSVVSAQSGGGPTQHLLFSLPDLFQVETRQVSIIEKPTSGALAYSFPNRMLVLSTDDAEGLDEFMVTALDGEANDVAYWEFLVELHSKTFLFTATHLSLFTDAFGNHSLGQIVVEGIGDATSGELLVTDITFKGKEEDVAKIQAIWDGIIERANEDKDGDGQPDNPELKAAIDQILNSGIVVEIEVVSGSSNVIAGSYNLGTVDVADIEAFPPSTPGFSPSAVLLHEVAEQWIKKKDGLGNTRTDYERAHDGAIAIQATWDGWIYKEQLPPIHNPDGTTTVPVIVEKDGTSKTIGINIQDNDITGVTVDGRPIENPPSSGGGGASGGSSGGVGNGGIE